MRKGKEFIFPENVNKSYGVYKGYTLKEILFLLGLTVLGLIFTALPPNSLVFVIIKFIITLFFLIIPLALIQVRPISERPNIRFKEYLATKQRYNKAQKIFFIKPIKRKEELLNVKKQK